MPKTIVKLRPTVKNIERKTRFIDSLQQRSYIVQAIKFFNDLNIYENILDKDFADFTDDERLHTYKQLKVSNMAIFAKLVWLNNKYCQWCIENHYMDNTNAANRTLQKIESIQKVYNQIASFDLVFENYFGSFEEFQNVIEEICVHDKYYEETKLLFALCFVGLSKEEIFHCQKTDFDIQNKILTINNKKIYVSEYIANLWLSCFTKKEQDIFPYMFATKNMVQMLEQNLVDSKFRYDMLFKKYYNNFKTAYEYYLMQCREYNNQGIYKKVININDDKMSYRNLYCSGIFERLLNIEREINAVFVNIIIRQSKNNKSAWQSKPAKKARVAKGTKINTIMFEKKKISIMQNILFRIMKNSDVAEDTAKDDVNNVSTQKTKYVPQHYKYFINDYNKWKIAYGYDTDISSIINEDLVCTIDIDKCLDVDNILANIKVS